MHSVGSFGSFIADQDWHYTIDAFNENGITKGKAGVTFWETTLSE
jgi:hypothetical protein